MRKTILKKWRTLNGDSLSGSLHSIIEETIQRERQAGHSLKVCIGSDSQVKGEDVDFATVFMFINNYSTKNNMSLKERMLAEVAKSVEVAYSICDLLDKYNVELEVHADINTESPNY